MEDLLTIHIKKIENGMLSIPPSKWCVKKSSYSIVWKLKGISEHLFCINGTYSDGLKQTPNQQLYKETFGEYLALAEIAQEYKNFEPSSSQLEECHRAKYVYEHPDTQIEVATPAGSIDCLTKAEIVELKVVTKWKDGFRAITSIFSVLPRA